MTRADSEYLLAKQRQDVVQFVASLTDTSTPLMAALLMNTLAYVIGFSFKSGKKPEAELIAFCDKTAPAIKETALEWFDAKERQLLQ